MGQSKPMRPRDRQLLERIVNDGEGILWRQQVIDALKRGGAKVYIDERKRLCAAFGERAFHISRMDLSLAEAGETAFRQDLKGMARDLLKVCGPA